jgi:hypothetical protein
MTEARGYASDPSILLKLYNDEKCDGESLELLYRAK